VVNPVAKVTPRLPDGLTAGRLEVRDLVLAAAFAARPERFPRGAPSAGVLLTEVWINKPQTPSPREEKPQ
jgi:putative transposase